MPRRFNWKQDVAHQLVDAYLNGKIQSARQLYNSMKNAGLRVSKNTVYSRVRQDLREVSWLEGVFWSYFKFVFDNFDQF